MKFSKQMFKWCFDARLITSMLLFLTFGQKAEARDADDYLPIDHWGYNEEAIAIHPNTLSLEWRFMHGDVDEQIAQITNQIKEHPDNAELYFKRASLYHGHGSLEEGLADYQQALSLGYAHPDLYYFMARLYREKGEPQSGLFYINQFLETGHAPLTGLIERARILAELDQFAEAIADYNKALSFSTGEVITVEHYQELAEATLQIDPGHPEKAIVVLDRGMEQLGEVIVLQLRAIEIEREQGNLEGVMVRMDKIIEGMARQESYYFKKAEMLQAAGRNEEAIKNYKLAEQALKQLPGRPKKYLLHA